MGVRPLPEITESELRFLLRQTAEGRQVRMDRIDWFRVGIVLSLLAFWALVIGGVWVICRLAFG